MHLLSTPSRFHTATLQKDPSVPYNINLIFYHTAVSAEDVNLGCILPRGIGDSPDAAESPLPVKMTNFLHVLMRFNNKSRGWASLQHALHMSGAIWSNLGYDRLYASMISNSGSTDRNASICDQLTKRHKCPSQHYQPRVRLCESSNNRSLWATFRSHWPRRTYWIRWHDLRLFFAVNANTPSIETSKMKGRRPGIHWRDSYLELFFLFLRPYEDPTLFIGSLSSCLSRAIDVFERQTQISTQKAR